MSILIIIAEKITLPLPFLKNDKIQAQNTKISPTIKAANGKIVISYADLDLFFKDCCDTVLKNVKSKQNGEDVQITGQASFPFSANFRGDIRPIAEKGKLHFRVDKLTLGKVAMPQMLADKILDLAQKYTDKKINNKYQVKDAKITGEGLEITTD